MKPYEMSMESPLSDGHFFLADLGR